MQSKMQINEWCYRLQPERSKRKTQKKSKSQSKRRHMPQPHHERKKTPVSSIVQSLKSRSKKKAKNRMGISMTPEQITRYDQQNSHNPRRTRQHQITRSQADMPSTYTSTSSRRASFAASGSSQNWHWRLSLWMFARRLRSFQMRLPSAIPPRIAASSSRDSHPTDRQLIPVPRATQHATLNTPPGAFLDA